MLSAKMYFVDRLWIHSNKQLSVIKEVLELGVVASLDHTSDV